MLHQELPASLGRPIGGSRWLLPVLGLAALASAAAVYLAAGLVAALALLACAAVGGAVAAIAHRSPAEARAEAIAGAPDYALIGAALGLSGEPAAITSRDGALLAANEPYRERFGALNPLGLASDEDSKLSVGAAVAMAWRDGAGCVAGVATLAGTSAVEVQRAGLRNDMLLWRFPLAAAADPLALAIQGISGVTGEQLGRAGVLAAVVAADGALLAANRAFTDRAMQGASPSEPARFTDLVGIGDDGLFHLPAEGEGGHAMRAVHVPVNPAEPNGAGTFLLFDSADGVSGSSAHLQALLDMLPIGLALVDRDGRFLTMNQAFRTAAGI